MNLTNHLIDGQNHKKNIHSNNIINKQITGDCNCFYNAISYYYHQLEEYNSQYRNLIYKACMNFIEEIKEFMISEYERNLNDIDRKFKKLYKKYI